MLPAEAQDLNILTLNNCEFINISGIPIFMDVIKPRN
jgi:hypothetical protein